MFALLTPPSPFLAQERITLLQTIAALQQQYGGVPPPGAPLPLAPHPPHSPGGAAAPIHGHGLPPPGGAGGAGGAGATHVAWGAPRQPARRRHAAGGKWH